jgi:hypothetical protein
MPSFHNNITAILAEDQTIYGLWEKSKESHISIIMTSTDHEPIRFFVQHSNNISDIDIETQHSITLGNKVATVLLRSKYFRLKIHNDSGQNNTHIKVVTNFVKDLTALGQQGHPGIGFIRKYAVSESTPQVGEINFSGSTDIIINSSDSDSVLSNAWFEQMKIYKPKGVIFSITKDANNYKNYKLRGTNSIDYNVSSFWYIESDGTNGDEAGTISIGDTVYISYFLQSAPDTLSYVQTTGSQVTIHHDDSMPFSILNADPMEFRGKPLFISCCGDVSFAVTPDGTGWTSLQLFRNSTAIGPIIEADNHTNLNSPFNITFIDMPPSNGSYTYRLKMLSIRTDATTTVAVSETGGPNIIVMELNS